VQIEQNKYNPNAQQTEKAVSHRSPL